ncbi:PAS domain-containing sensor histidine kinase [Microbacterium sp. RD1]|uniref:PAS domain-containing sensor histidine kinase n=1 Tax=Microbacterium sp. RD1 TaxID=3457313 RepID=UPI003FA56EA6
MHKRAYERAHPVDPAFRAAQPPAPDAAAPIAPVTALPSLTTASDWAHQVTSVAIYRLDPSGRVRTWNAGAERIKGYKAREIIGQSFERFYRPQERAQHKPARLLELAARDGTAEDTGWRVRADGSTFWAAVILTAVRDERGVLTGYAKITRDLTAMKRQEEERAAFLRAFAHDFLSPITALRGYVDLLQEAAPEHSELVDRVATVSDHLVAMMDELSQHIRGGAGEPLAPVHIAALVREAGELMLPGEAFQRLQISGDESTTVRTNGAVLRRAVANLIDNAAKYSDGDIRIEITDTHSEVAVKIADSGRGIAPEDLPTIFDMHARGRLADPADGGSGVGLASVREIVERLGGEVAITSTLGGGTTVTLLLPPAASLSR